MGFRNKFSPFPHTVNTLQDSAWFVRSHIPKGFGQAIEKETQFSVELQWSNSWTNSINTRPMGEKSCVKMEKYYLHTPISSTDFAKEVSWHHCAIIPKDCKMRGFSTTVCHHVGYAWGIKQRGIALENSSSGTSLMKIITLMANIPGTLVMS